MPIPYNDISAVTVNYIVPELVDNYYKVSPVFVLVFKGESVRGFPGGNQIQQPIQYAPLKAGAFAPGGTFDIIYVNTDTAMTFNVKFYYANVTIQGTQLPLNRGDCAVMSFVEEKMINGSQALAAALAGDMYGDGQGTVTSQIALDGFLAAYDDGTNYPSYGGLSRAAIGSGANSGINGYYQNVAGPLSIPTLQKAYGQATFGNKQPNLLTTTQAIYNSLYNKMVPAQRVMDTTSDLFSIGFQALRFNNQQLVVVEPQCLEPDREQVARGVHDALRWHHLVVERVVDGLSRGQQVRLLVAERRLPIRLLQRRDAQRAGHVLVVAVAAAVGAGAEGCTQQPAV